MGDDVIFIKIFIKLSLNCVDILGRKSDVGYSWNLIGAGSRPWDKADARSPKNVFRAFRLKMKEKGLISIRHS